MAKVRILKVGVLLLVPSLLQAQSLMDSLATPETVALWSYLKSVYGKKIITGLWEQRQADDALTCSGKLPAILGQDMNGWNLPRESPDYQSALAEQSGNLIKHYAKGGIIQVNWHWSNPFDRKKDAWSELTSVQWEKLVQPGTPEYNVLIEDIDYHVENFLKKLVDPMGKPIPILFRPLHEIDGGWFWWTCKTDGTKTAMLYRILQDRILNYHHLHNLIWIFNPGADDKSDTERLKFYPGANRIDLAGIDLYFMNYATDGAHTTQPGQSYRTYYDQLARICPGKMLALCEGEAMPNAEKMKNGETAFPRWLYTISWWAKDEESGFCTTKPCNPCAWIATGYKSDFVITLDQLPKWVTAPTQSSLKVRTHNPLILINPRAYRLNGGIITHIQKKSLPTALSRE